MVNLNVSKNMRPRTFALSIVASYVYEKIYSAAFIFIKNTYINHQKSKIKALDTTNA